MHVKDDPSRVDTPRREPLRVARHRTSRSDAVASCCAASPRYAGRHAHLARHQLQGLRRGRGRPACSSRRSARPRAASRATRIDVDEAVVYCSAAAPDGTAYARHRRPGQRLRLPGRQAAASSPSSTRVLVTSLAVGPDGTVFAGTMPGGRVYAIDRDGKAREWPSSTPSTSGRCVYDAGASRRSTPPPARRQDLRDRRQHLERRRRPRAPALGHRREAPVVAACAATTARSTPARPTRRSCIASARRPAARRRRRCTTSTATRCAPSPAAATTLYVAVNEFQKPARPRRRRRPAPAAPRGTKIVLPATTPAATTAASGRVARSQGPGAIYRVDPDGRVEQLHALADGYFTALHVDTDGNVWAAAGANGRVYLIRPDRTVITAFDLPERQVLTLAFDAAHKGGQRPARHRRRGRALPRRARAAARTRTTSPRCFDAQFPSRWGNAALGAATARSRSRRARATPRSPTRPGAAGRRRRSPRSVGDGGVGRVASPSGALSAVSAPASAARARCCAI